MNKVRSPARPAVVIDNVKVKSHSRGWDVNNNTVKYQITPFKCLMQFKVRILLSQNNPHNFSFHWRFKSYFLQSFLPFCRCASFDCGVKWSHTLDLFNMTLNFPLMSTSVLKCENHLPATLDLDTLSRFNFLTIGIWHERQFIFQHLIELEHFGRCHQLIHFKWIYSSPLCWESSQ